MPAGHSGAWEGQLRGVCGLELDTGGRVEEETGIKSSPFQGQRDVGALGNTPRWREEQVGRAGGQRLSQQRQEGGPREHVPRGGRSDVCLVCSSPRIGFTLPLRGLCWPPGHRLLLSCGVCQRLSISCCFMFTGVWFATVPQPRMCLNRAE